LVSNCAEYYAKLRLVGESVTSGARPTPVSGTIWWLPGALSVIVSAPFRVPSVLGMKVIAIMQFDPAPKFPPTGHVLV